MSTTCRLSSRPPRSRSRAGAWFRSAGKPRCRRAASCCRCRAMVARRGIHEYPFGVTLGEVLADCGAYAVKAVQVGGPSGHLVGPADFGRRIAFEDLTTTGSLMVFDTEPGTFWRSCRTSSISSSTSPCGFCTPCRVGTTMLRTPRRPGRRGAGERSGSGRDRRDLAGHAQRQPLRSGAGARRCRCSMLCSASVADFAAKLSGRGRDPGFRSRRSAGSGTGLAGGGAWLTKKRFCFDGQWLAFCARADRDPGGRGGGALYPPPLPSPGSCPARLMQALFRSRPMAASRRPAMSRSEKG